MDRGYVYKRSNQLVPDFTAFSVVNLLSTHFPDLVDYAFTARMEDDLDRIAKGEQERIPWLKRFYFGDARDEPGLKSLVSDHLDGIDPRSVNELLLGSDSEGKKVVVRVGRFGPYIQRGEESKTLPEGILPDELTTYKALEILQVPDKQVLGQDPETGEEVSVCTGRYGPYVQLGEGDKPKRASLFSTMTTSSVTLEDALQLLSLPRVVGASEDGEIVMANNGRYGPFIRKGDETRSLESEEKIFEVTLEDCLKLLSQPKPQGRQARRQAATLREIGTDPETDKPIQLKSGRYGPYVTDGETNASLGKGDEVEAITLEQALELLRRRRERIAADKKGQRSSGKKSTAKGKAATKKKTATKNKPAAKKKTAAKSKPAAKGKAAAKKK